MPTVSLIISQIFLRYSGRIDKFCHIPLSYTSNYKATPSLKFQTFTWLKVETKLYWMKNFLKVPVWSNKINNLQNLFQSLAFQAKYFLQKNAHFIISLICRLGVSEWIHGYKIQKREGKWKYLQNKKSEPFPEVYCNMVTNIFSTCNTWVTDWVLEQPLEWKNKRS